MKYFLTLIMIALFAVPAYGGIVTNGANDSISFQFVLWDSTGNSTVALADGDSVFLLIWYPNGQYCYKDSTDFNDTEITGETSSDFTTYTWRDDMTDIDGTPVYGASYHWEIIALDLTSADTKTRSTGEFTILPNFIDDYDGTGYAGGTIKREVDLQEIDGAAASAESLGVILNGSETTIMEQVDANQADLNTIITDVTGINGWVPIVDNESLIVDQSTNTALKPTTAGRTLDVRTTGEAGVDIDNAYGAWGTADFDADFLAASLIADDAFVVANFAGSEPGAWWNEGKTGYTISGDTYTPDVNMIQISGDAGAADNWETMTDGTGGSDFIIDSLHVRTFVIKNASGTGTGFHVESSTGYAAWIKSTAAGVATVYIDGSGGTDLDGLKVEGVGAGNGIEAIGGGSGKDFLGDLSGSVASVTGAVGSVTGAVGTVTDTVNAILDTIQAHAPHGNDWGQGAGDVTDVKDTVNAILDTIQAHAPHGNDWGQGGGSLTAIADTVNAIIDTLQNQDGWIAKEATVQIIDDTLDTYDNANRFQADVQEILDTLQVYDNANQLRLELAAILDTLQLHDDWVGTKTKQNTIIDTVDAILDTLQNRTAHTATDIADTLVGRGYFTGGGTEPETLIVYNGADTTTIEGASIVIRTLDQTTIIVDGWETDVNGTANLELDVANYFRSVTHNNYTQVNDTLAVASGGGTDSLFMTAFNPGAAPAGGTGRLYGRIKDISGTVTQGVIIKAQIPRVFWPTTYSGDMITPFVRSDTTDANGDWSLDLYQYSVVSIPSSLTDSLYYIITAFEPSTGGIIGGEMFSIGYYMPTLSDHKLVFGGAYEKDLD